MPKGFLRWFDIIMLGVYLGVAVVVCLNGSILSGALVGVLVGRHVGDMWRHKLEGDEDNLTAVLIKKQDELITKLTDDLDRGFFKDFDNAIDRLEKLRQTPREGDEWKENNVTK